MKKYFTILYGVCISSIVLLSCKKVENYLDKPPGVDINENVVFSARIETEKYVSTLYQYGMTSIFPLRAAEINFSPGLPSSNGGLVGTSNTSFVGATDEGEHSESFSTTQNWNSGNITPLNVVAAEDLRYFLRWQAIRAANILLERVDEVPDADAAYKDQVKGEALFIRALNNFETFKRYGGFPIVEKRLVTLEESKIPRSKLEDCVNAIVRDCDEAVAKLPANQPTNFQGRAHKGAALALKARTLLYAASPLFNALTPPVSFGNAEDDKLVCYGNVDNNRWKLASDAQKAVLDWAQANGYALIDVPANRIPFFAPGGIVNGNYRTAWQQPNNPEVILGSNIWTSARNNGQFPWQFILPRSNYVPNGGGNWTPPSVTFNFLRKYEKRDGTPQTWNLTGGNDLLQKYNELDPRFCQTVCYVGSRLHVNVTRIQIWQGGTSDKVACKGGAWMLKFIPDALPTAAQFVNCPIFRVNEVLLSYAEALNEFAAGPPIEAYDAVNRVRNRSGMPNLPVGLSKAQFRQKVRNERDIELAFEDYRLCDIRRWLVAEEDGVMAGNMWGLEINRLNTATPFPTAFSYLPFVFETRTFPRRLYLYPFDNTEVLKGNLKQNPGW